MPTVQTPNNPMEGVTMNGGRTPTVVLAPATTSAELSARPRRRTFTAKDKLRMLADVDSATGTGATGAILRREGLYSSILSDWRRQRDVGALGALSPGKRGPKTAAPNPLTIEVAQLQRTNDRPTQELLRPVLRLVQPGSPPCRDRPDDAGSGAFRPGGRCSRGPAGHA